MKKLLIIVDEQVDFTSGMMRFTLQGIHIRRIIWTHRRAGIFR